jgi:tetratricopeptide (TPR) repeat protein
MIQRLIAAILLSALALAPHCGCQSIAARGAVAGSGTVQTADTPKADANKAQLPREQAALLCIATAESLEKDHHEAEAIAQYEKARQFNPRLINQTARRLAVLYDRQGEFSKAVAEYQRALQASPKDTNLLNDIGYCYYEQSNWPEAEKWLRAAVRVDPNNQRAWTNLGLTYGQEKRYQEGLDAFTHVVSPAEAQCNLAFIYSTQGKHDEARRAYMAASRMQPDLALAQAALGKLSTSKARPPAVKETPESEPEPKATSIARLDNFVEQQLAAPAEPKRDSLPTVAKSPAAVETVIAAGYTKVETEASALKAPPMTANSASLPGAAPVAEPPKPSIPAYKPIARTPPRTDDSASSTGTSQPATVEFE